MTKIDLTEATGPEYHDCTLWSISSEKYNNEWTEKHRDMITFHSTMTQARDVLKAPSYSAYFYPHQ